MIYNKFNEAKDSFFQTIKLLWRLESIRRVQIAALIILMLFCAISEMLSVGAAIPFITILTNPDQSNELFLLGSILKFLNLKETNEIIIFVTIIFITIIFLAGIFRLLATISLQYMAATLSTEFSCIAYKHSLYQPYSQHLKSNSSEFISRILDKTQVVVYQSIIPIMNIIQSFLILILITGMLIYVNPTATLIILSFLLGMYLLVIVLFKPVLERNGQTVNKIRPKLLQLLQESMGGIREIILDGSQNFYRKIFRESASKFFLSKERINITSQSPKIVIETLGIILFAFVAYLLLSRSGSINQHLPIIGALLFASQRVLPVINIIYSSWSLLKGYKSEVNDFIELLESPNEISSSELENINELQLEESIEVSNLSFKYSAEGQTILNDISFKISKGESLGLIGLTGSGKTTLINFIMGLIDSKEGSLLIDGKEITNINKRSWQKCVAHVPQSIYLADTTIIENIAFGIPKEDIDKDKVIRVSKVAKIFDTINSWQDKYETTVGEEGVRISGGQRQRIAIARALYKNAKVLILDEATSALDVNTENEIMLNIDKLEYKPTKIIISHRENSLSSCDKLMKIEKGKIIPQEI